MKWNRWRSEVGDQPGTGLASVLIAEDDPVMRLMLRTILRSDRYLLLVAADGDEAWTLLQERPAVAVLDVTMPGRTGLELTHAIRHDPALADTFVILVTAWDQEAAVSAGYAAGVDRYLTKPFSPAELLAAITEGLDHGAGTDRAQALPAVSPQPT